MRALYVLRNLFHPSSLLFAANHIRYTKHLYNEKTVSLPQRNGQQDWTLCTDALISRRSSTGFFDR